MNFDRKPTTECLIKGEKVAYDVCAHCLLHQAKDFYNPEVFQYIGSGRTYYIGGTENKPKAVHHFFVYTPEYEHLRNNFMF